ncbi:MAG: pilin [Candidatus Jorgensenbacteria bacterium]
MAVIANIWEGAKCGDEIITTGGPKGPCDFCDGLIVTSNVIQFIWQIAFVVAVGMIVWGALQLMTSGGSEERVSKGKKTMTAAVTGLVIALVAWLVVSEILQFLSGEPSFPWSQITCG